MTFKNRYRAKKERRTNPFCNGAEMIIKVDGGYVLMDARDYQIWKMQK